MQAVLGSWKEIANYLGKGVRTVQRWERYSGLPIHRPSGSTKGVVIAFPEELDKWARRQDKETKVISRSAGERNAALSLELINQTRQLRTSTRELIKQTGAFMAMARRRRNEMDDEDDRFPGEKSPDVA